MQISFLPWANVRSEHRVGNVTISPWSTIRDGIDSKTRAYLDTYFTRHVGNDGEPVEGLAVVFLNGDIVRELNSAERAVLRSGINAFAFASTVPHLRRTVHTGNTGFGLPKAERFQLVTQKFKRMSADVTVVSGGVKHSWSIGEIHFCVPWHAGSSWYETDSKMLSALGRLLTRKRGIRQRKRIYRAIEWFRLAHSGSDETSDQTRVVMMATAFEVLLDPTERFRKKMPMMQTLDRLTASSKLRTTRVRTNRTKAENMSVLAAWFGRFYDLRNAVVHGDDVPNSRLCHPTPRHPSLTHLDIADLVFWEAVSWELSDAKLLGQSAREYANWLSRRFGYGRAEPEFVRQVMSDSMGIDVEEYHDDLGWTKAPLSRKKIARDSPRSEA